MPGGEGDAADRLGVGVGAQRAVGEDGVEVMPEAARARAARAGRRTATMVPAADSSSRLVPWDTMRPLPITTRSSAMTSISCSRCEDSRTVPPRSA